ncbi:IclR family transcriptional regulator [Microbacterium sp.]|uniref:IclR family transcriptional regulator n=1 Tax=Microbacterium sp. TaxID=51671 RepID=UPI003A8E3DE4
MSDVANERAPETEAETAAETAAGTAAAPGLPKSTVDRTLLILGTFQNQQRRQTLSEISRATGLPIATCYRIVQRLAEWGALERDAEGRYYIGLRLWQVAALAPQPSRLQRAAQSYMQDLFEATGHAVHLAIRDGLELVSVERFHGGRRPVPRPIVGGRYPMHATAIGHVLLAYAPYRVREQVLAGPFERFTSRTLTTRSEVEAVIERVRRVGYAICDRHVDEFHCSVAAPIHGHSGAVVAALSVAFTDRDVNPLTQVDLVRVTARRISLVLKSMGRQADAFPAA